MIIVVAQEESLGWQGDEHHPVMQSLHDGDDAEQTLSIPTVLAMQRLFEPTYLVPTGVLC